MTDRCGPKGIEDIYGLTPIQQGLLFEQLAEPRSGVYIEQLRLSFRGTLDEGDFQRAWQLVVDRHPVLRTSFHLRDTEPPLQVVHQSAELPLEVLDWRGTPAEQLQHRIDEWLERERAEGFDLPRAPLMRITVVRTADCEWTLLWRLSHLLMDGWSFSLAMSDFLACYRALRTGRDPQLAPMRPYRDYASWWARQGGEKEREFWRQELAGFTPPGPLHAPGQPAEHSEARGHCFVDMPLDDLHPGLLALSRDSQLTLNTLLQGAWMLVLARHYGSDDIVCGFTMAHRPPDLPGAEGIMGPLIATMPVRERLDPGRAALSWFKDLQTHIAAVRENAALPLYEVQRAAGLSLDVPLLESSVSYENTPMPDFDLDGTGLAYTGLHYDGRPHYPITMVIMPGEGLPLRVIHDRRRFCKAAAERFCTDVRAVLCALIAAPDAPLGELADPFAAAPVAAATGPEPQVAAESLPTTLARLATEAPEAIAISCGDATMTYRQLVEFGDAVATVLAEHGVAPGDRVGIRMARSQAQIAAMVGVLRAGAAYVPLPPKQPDARLAAMAADARLAAVLTDPEHADRPTGTKAPVITIDGIPPTPRGVPDLPQAAPDDPAYVLYTSGSTGLPKAVVVTHRNVQSLLAAGRAVFGFGAHEVWSHCHSFAFDYSVWEIWGALGNGARLVVVPEWTVRSPRELFGLLCSEGVTVASQTPALFEHLGEAAAEADAGTGALRHLFIGGDRLQTSAVRAWIAQYGDERPRLYNLYGVTEAAVVSTWHRVTAAQTARDGALPIGRTLPNQRAYLVNPLGRPVPDGEVGELLLAGPAVARGYLGRKELTARRFSGPAHIAAPGERLYRTGDLAHVGADGALRHLGRSDGQVKIRGHRVEPGEVEAAVRAHPAVRAAVAVPRNAPGGLVELFCHCVPAGARVPVEEVRAFTAARLPAHMVPAAFGWLDELPLTVGGKVDVHALPEPGAPRPAAAEPPRAGLEHELADLLADVLGVRALGRHDRFAELGLHSVHVMRIAGALRSRWHADVPLRALYAAADLAELAALARKARS